MNKHLIKMIVVTIVFVAFIGLHMFGIYSKETNSEDELVEVSLPVVSMIYEGTRINTLCGYTMDMEEEYMRDCITPINGDNTVEIQIDRYDNTIVNISYELRTIDATRLIEEKTVDYFAVTDSGVDVELKLSDIIESDMEYMLSIILVTENHEKINYYTRVIRQTESNVKTYIDYVRAFSNSTFDREKFADYKIDIERWGYNDDTNFGYINNDSDTASLTWGNLKPEIISAPAVLIKEILGDISCIQLKYMVRAKNEYGSMQTYNVTEYFRLRQGPSSIYVYVYRRSMDQIFECTKDNVSAERINLGIDSDLSVKISESPTGAYISFVKERNLWCMDINENRMMKIFSLDSGNTKDIRDRFDNCDIEIISTNQDGEVLFLVYGYMNRGGHEGKVGVALYRYSVKDNKLKELVFVPSTKNYYVLKENIGKFAYITSENLLYLMLEDGIYTITFDSNEYVQIVSGLKEGNFIISEDNQVVAWHENGSLYDTDTIRVLDIENNKDYAISAKDGEKIKVLGFVGHDLVYGTAKSSDIVKKDNNETVFPMYKLEVMLNENGEIEKYQKDGVYITDIKINDNVINLKRVKKNAENVYEETSDDQYISKLSSNPQMAEKYEIATDLKKKQVVIEMPFQTTSENVLTAISPETIEFTNANSLTLSSDADYIDPKYYVYAEGELTLCTENISEAVGDANDKYGVVVDGRGNYVWARISKSNSTSITGIDSLISKTYTSLSKVVKDEDREVLDIQGVASETLFYYTTLNKPVITYMEDVGMVVVSAHFGYSTILNAVEFTNLITGEVFELNYDEALEILDKNKRYIVIEK